MTDSHNSAPDGIYYTLERENQELQKVQVRRINDTLKKVRRISEECQQLVGDAPVVEGRVAVSSGDDPGFCHEPTPASTEVGSNGKGHPVEFSLPEPDVYAAVSRAIDKALFLIEKERKEFTPKKNSPVVRRWRIL